MAAKYSCAYGKFGTRGCARGVAVDYFLLMGQIGIDVKQKGI